MKKKITIAVATIVFLIAGIFVAIMGLGIGKARRQGMNIVYDNQVYVEADSPYQYIKDEMIAITSEGIRLYSVKGDKACNYLIDSHSGCLYIKEGYEPPKTEVTGIIVYDGVLKADNDEQLLELVSELSNMQQEPDTISRESYFYTTDRAGTGGMDINICYDNCWVSFDYFGEIVKGKNGYLFIASEQLINNNYELVEYMGIRIDSKYDALLDTYRTK